MHKISCVTIVHNIASSSIEARSDDEDSFDDDEEQERICRLHMRIQKDEYLRVIQCYYTTSYIHCYIVIIE